MEEKVHGFGLTSRRWWTTICSGVVTGVIRAWLYDAMAPPS
ncbi:hypothetical protein [Nocardioides convexus]|nr:hypothetical protein [Nocardioides convexus]